MNMVEIPYYFAKIEEDQAKVINYIINIQIIGCLFSKKNNRESSIIILKLSIITAPIQFL